MSAATRDFSLVAESVARFCEDGRPAASDSTCIPTHELVSRPEVTPSQTLDRSMSRGDTAGAYAIWSTCNMAIDRDICNMAVDTDSR